MISTAPRIALHRAHQQRGTCSPSRALPTAGKGRAPPPFPRRVAVGHRCCQGLAQWISELGPSWHLLDVSLRAPLPLGQLGKARAGLGHAPRPGAAHPAPSLCRIYRAAHIQALITTVIRVWCPFHTHLVQIRGPAGRLLPHAALECMIQPWAPPALPMPLNANLQPPR